MFLSVLFIPTPRVAPLLLLGLEEHSELALSETQEQDTLG